MTSLRENIKKSLDDNLKKRDDIATATLRLILAAVKDSDIENRTKKKGDTISDQQILLLLQNMVKQRKQSIIQYEEGGRIELAEREREEIKIIQEFLPNQLTNDEIQAEISKIIDAEDQLSIKDMGKIMGELKNKFSGRMDFGKASEIVKALLK